MTAIRLLVACSSLAACTSASEADAIEAAEVTLAAWDEAGLPEPRNSCRLDRLTVRFPDTTEAYLSVCPPNSWACLSWRAAGPSWPVTLIHPELPDERVGAAVVHEMLHAIGYCAEAWPDGMDYHHADLRVWWSGGPDSVETRAELALEGRDGT